MSIISPDRLNSRLTQLWYATDDKLHQPIIQWLDTSGARPHLENFCNQLIAKASQAAVKREVPKRTMYVQIYINLVKAAQAYWNNIPPEARGSLRAEHVQFAIEMILEEAKYTVIDSVMTYELHVPPLQEKRQPEPEPEPEPEEEEDDDEDNDDDEDQIQAIIASEPSPTSSEGPEEPETMAFEESPIEVGLIYGNGNGVHRRVDAMEKGNVSYTVTQGNGSVKKGATGSVSYKGFVGWVEEQI